MKNTRNIKFIVVHCTGTQPNATIEAIKGFWKETCGWGDIPGHHYIIKRDGETLQLLDENKISYGAFGHNPESIHVSYIGGLDKDGKPFDTRTHMQREALFGKLVELSERYPQAQIIGHRDLSGTTTECPGFDVKQWLKSHVPDFDNAA